MKKLILIIAAIAINQATVFSQGCLPEGISFQSQVQVDSFQYQYPGCTKIEGSVFINGAVYNLHGLNVLTSIGGDLTIDCVPLIDMTGLDSITYIGGNLGFFDTHFVDMTGLGSLDTIGGDMSIGCLGHISVICNNPELVSFNGLESLTHIAGKLNILDNNALTNMNALAGLTSVGGIDIRSNSNLTSLAGLENINAGAITYLTLAGNNSLAFCNVQSICNYLSSPGGQVNLYGNAAGCNNPTEVAEDCGISLPCLPYGNYYFFSQEEIDNYHTNYPTCNEIQGTVNVHGSSINNLNGLLGIHSISGFLEILYNEGLLNLNGLDSLHSVGGTLNIAGNVALLSLTGLNSLSSVENDLEFKSNPAVASLAGLESLTSIGGDLNIRNCDTLASLTGLDNLISIGGKLEIRANRNLISLTALENLTTLGGDLSIGYKFGYYGGNASLTSLAGLNNISAGSINNLVIAYNQSLSNCEVQSVCDYLVSPNGTVNMASNAPGCNSPDEVIAACQVGLENNPEKGIFTIYPNPSPSQFTFEFSLQQQSMVNLVVLNNLGQVVAKLVDGVLTPGPHHLDWNAGNLPAGMYYLHLETENQVITKKIIKQ